MDSNFIKTQIREILEGYPRAREIEAELYFLDKKGMDKILLLEAGARYLAEDSGSTKKGKRKDPFYQYAKIINPQAPAFKYKIYFAKRPREIFDRQKVLAAIPGTLEVWKNTERKHLREYIENKEDISTDEIDRLTAELDERISIEENEVNYIVEHFDEYDVAITNAEENRLYPSLYYVMVDPEDRNKTLTTDTHLRKEVPNVLWQEDTRPYSMLRANDRVGRIVKTHKRIMDRLYVKKRG
jgi:hypothetical protein